MPTIHHRYQPAGPLLVRASTAPGTFNVPPPPDLNAVADSAAWLATAWSSRQLREAITLASPDLAGRVEQLLHAERPPSKKAVRRAVLATASYLRRWQRRATPFGLFAGITSATVGPATGNVGEQHRAIARVDADWLARVVDRLEHHHGLRRTLTMVANSAGYVRDGRYIVAARPQPGQPIAGPIRETSTRYTRPVRLALAHAARPVRFDDLADRLGADLPQADPHAIDAILHRLIDGHVLITNLRPPMTAEDPLAHVIAALDAANATQLPEVAALAGQLGSIHERLNRHNASTDPGQQARHRPALAQGMARIVPAAETPLAVDVRLDTQISLPQQVLDEAAHAAGVLLRLTTQPFGSPAWLDYHAHFRARYGPGAVIPVRDLVADAGLGYPPGYLGAPRARPTWRILTERDAYLLGLIQQAMLDGAEEIQLSDADIQALTVGDPTAVFPPHRIELGVSLHTVCADALNRGQFQLRITAAPRAYTSMAGRFAYLLDPVDRQHLAQTYTPPPGSQDTIAAQLSFPPRRVHNENVMRVGRLTPVVVSVAEQPDGDTISDTISIDDLAVTADGDQLYLLRRSTSQRVIAFIPHALDTTVQAPPLARFIAEVGHARSAVFGPLDLGAAARTLRYTPRLRYGRTVLAPARWSLSRNDLTAAHMVDGDGWDKTLGRWRQRWRVPSRVVVCHDELRLPLDLDDPLDRALLQTRLHRADRLELLEDGPAGGDRWLGRPAELLIPMTLTTAPARPVPDPAVEGPTHRPGHSAVVLARLIGNPARFDDILTSHLPAFADTLTDLGLLRWWVSRHRDMIRLDADQHLSLFFRLESPAGYGAAAARLAQLAQKLHTHGLPNELVLAAYHEQHGRYGNPPAYQAAEHLFAADTAAAIAQLRAAEQAGVDGQALAAASMAQLAAGFAADPITGYRTLLTCLQGKTDPADRPLCDLARDLADPRDRYRRLRAIPGGDAVLAAWQGRGRALRGYHEGLQAQRNPADMLPTLLHEHHIRALGVDPDFERRTRHLARAAAMCCLARAGGR